MFREILVDKHSILFICICTCRSNPTKQIVDIPIVCFSGEAESELNFTEFVDELNERYKVRTTYNFKKLSVNGDCLYFTRKFELWFPKHAAKKLIEENQSTTMPTDRELKLDIYIFI